MKSRRSQQGLYLGCDSKPHSNPFFIQQIDGKIMQHKLAFKNCSFGSLRDQSLVIFPFGQMLFGHLVENPLEELVASQSSSCIF